MTNIFKKNKVKADSIEENYWKLSAIERIDYDNKVNEIKNNFNIELLYLTSIGIKIVCVMFFIFILGAIATSMPISDIIDITIALAREFYLMFVFLLGFDVFKVLLTLMFDSSGKRIKKLNERFKLC